MPGGRRQQKARRPHAASASPAPFSSPAPACSPGGDTAARYVDHGCQLASLRLHVPHGYRWILLAPGRRRRRPQVTREPLARAPQAPAAGRGRCQGTGISPALRTPVPGDKISSLRKKKKKAKAVPCTQGHSLFSGSISLTRSQKRRHSAPRAGGTRHQSRAGTGCPVAGRGSPASHTLSWHTKKHFSLPRRCPQAAQQAQPLLPGKHPEGTAAAETRGMVTKPFEPWRQRRFLEVFHRKARKSERVEAPHEPLQACGKGGATKLLQER